MALTNTADALQRYSDVFAAELERRLVMLGITNDWYQDMAADAFSVRIVQPTGTVTTREQTRGTSDTSTLPGISTFGTSSDVMNLDQIVDSDAYVPFDDLTDIPTRILERRAREQAREHAETIDDALVNYVLGSTAADPGVITKANVQVKQTGTSHLFEVGDATHYLAADGAWTLPSGTTVKSYLLKTLRQIRNGAIGMNMLQVGERALPVNVYLPTPVGIAFQDMMVDGDLSEALTNRFIQSGAMPSGYIGDFLDMSFWMYAPRGEFTASGKKQHPIIAATSEWMTFAMKYDVLEARTGAIAVMEGSDAKVKHGSAFYSRQRYGRKVVTDDRAFVSLVRGEA